MISPHFHLVYDYYFETVNSHSDKPLEFWDDFIQFNSFISNFDDPYYAPVLDKYFLI